MKRREFITLLGGRVAACGARAAAGDEFVISLGRNDRANLAQAFRGLSE